MISMYPMALYDLMESARNTQTWLGASARALGSYPWVQAVPNPAMQMLAAWGDLTEHSFDRMVVKPGWGIPTFAADNRRDHVVTVDVKVSKPFGDLLHFNVHGRKARPYRVLLVAPMSGHYATLLRATVESLMRDCEVYVTDWHNARDIPVSAGKFDIEDYTDYLIDYMRYLGPQTHVIAVCQPAPLTLAAAAWLAEREPGARPQSLILIGGPIDPDAAPTEVTDFGRRMTMGQLETAMIQQVSLKYKGAGRKVYPGLLQLASFISMNLGRHTQSFQRQMLRIAAGEAGDHDRHNTFYDEYLAVMDMTAEFYLSTVERVFKGREIARDAFTVRGEPIHIAAVRDIATMIVEGEEDDISAPGQCLAALGLLTNLPDGLKAAHLEPGVGHYGIFAGKAWRRNIRPLVLDFIAAHAGSRAGLAARPKRVRAAKPGMAATRTRVAAAAAPQPAAAKPSTLQPAAAAPSAAKPSAAKPSAVVVPLNPPGSARTAPPAAATKRQAD